MPSRSSNSSTREGNPISSLAPKKGQISPAKCWAFTINNYTDSIILSLSSIVPLVNYLIVGKEVGEKTHTPHLQCYAEFKKKLRPLSLGLTKSIHWEKAKGNRQQNEAYCKKDDNVIEELCIGFFLKRN